MLNLNLLPAQIKEEIKLKRLYNLLKKISFIVLLLPFVYGGALWSAKTMLVDTLDNLEEHTLIVNRNSQGYNKKVKQINAQIKNIEEIEKNFSFLSCSLKEVANSVPEGIKLTKLNIDKNQKTLKIEGYAETRSQLLKFKDKLQSLKLIETVDLPLENLLSQKNINFSLSAKLK